MDHGITAPQRRARTALLGAPALAAMIAAVTACGSGEGRPDEELSGLVHEPKRPPETVDVASATRDLPTLLRAASLNHARVGALLGPHTVTGKSHTEVHEKGAVVEVIEDEMGIELDAKGNFHAQVDNSKEYGRDVYFVGGYLFQRPRYGKFHRRRPADDGEPARIRSEVFSAFAATLDLLSPGVALADGGEVTVAGRRGRLVKLSRAREPRKPAKQTLTQRKWRESAVVRDASGEVVLDTKTGVVLRAAIQGALSFQRDGRDFEMRLEARHELGTFGSVEEVSPPAPELVVVDGDQRHELDERDSLLEGIAPKAARGKATSPGQ